MPSTRPPAGSWSSRSAGAPTRFAARYFTDDWGSYSKLIPPDKHVVGKCHTQRIENKNLLFRMRIKRLARKIICFSKSETKSETMHDTVIGLFINRYCFN